MLVIAFTQIQ